MDYNKAFSELTPQEFAVLYWKSQGLTHVQVGDILGWGIDNVQRINSNAHRKLGLGELLPKRREPILENEIYPALREWITQHTDALDRLRPPLDPQLNPGTREERGRVRREIQTVSEPFRGQNKEKSSRDETVLEGEPVDPDEYAKRTRETESSEEGDADTTTGTGGRTWVQLILGVAVLLCVLWFAGNGILAFVNRISPPLVTDTASPTEEFTPTSSNSLPSRTPNPATSPTLDISLTSTLSPTPEIPVTAVSSRLRDDFSLKLSDWWQFNENPIVNEQGNLGDYNGVLTVNMNEAASIWTNELPWPNYTVSLRSSIPEVGVLMVAVRLMDFNNFMGLSCDSRSGCVWLFVYEGHPSTLTAPEPMRFNPLTITVEGNKVTAIGSEPGFADEETSIDIPAIAHNELQGGAVLIQVSNETEVDYVQIEPIP